VVVIVLAALGQQEVAHRRTDPVEIPQLADARLLVLAEARYLIERTWARAAG